MNEINGYSGRKAVTMCDPQNRGEEKQAGMDVVKTNSQYSTFFLCHQDRSELFLADRTLVQP
jgi:hypothetical protein